LGRIKTTIVAIDALCFSDPTVQYKPEFINRELNKAYCGFYDPHSNKQKNKKINETTSQPKETSDSQLPIATG
jgi:poly(ADP-ribose) glycohydrolase